MGEIDPYHALRALSPYAQRLVRARLSDYAIAIGSAPAWTPVIGRHLEPLGGMAALGVWASRYLPDFVAAGRDRYHPGNSVARREESRQTGACLRAALRDVVVADDLDGAWPQPGSFAPFLSAAAQRKHIHRSSIRYGDNAGQVLDVWRRDNLPRTPAPVLIFLPGGAWVFGSRLVQGHELMVRLAQMGWVCLSVEYRTSPRHRWPRQITDVKAAIAWARANAGQFGGDPGFIVVAGCSAGGHLATLAGLTQNDPQWQTRLQPGADTSVDGVVSMYGRYDWQDRSTPERARFMDFLERVVVQRSQTECPQVFRDASPLSRIVAEAPPFLVIHGSRDAVIPVAEARGFVDRLRVVSTNRVCYAELPGAGHGFDLVDAARTGPVVHAITLFLDHVHRGRTVPVSEVV